jgi:hypothetical protein
MRNGVFLFWVTFGAASAQTILTPDAFSKLAMPTPQGSLKCEARALKPVLDFSLRFRGGYTVSVPLDQYHGSGHRWTVMLEIQPDGGKLVRLLDRFNVPDLSDVKVDGEAGGGFLVGEGHYRVNFLLMDDQARACHADWDIDAKLGGASHGMHVAIEPGTVQEISSQGTAPAKARTAPLGKLTVLMHAAPVSPRSPLVQASDAVTLLGALSSLLELAPARSVRLVVFNLDQRKEIYRQEQFTRDQLEAVREALFGLRLGTVDYKQLKNPNGHLELLARLVDEELRADNRSDAVVFLGPRAAVKDKVSLPSEITRGALPKFFYVEYQEQTRPMLRDDYPGWSAGPTSHGGHADREDIDGNARAVGGPPPALGPVDAPLAYNDVWRDSIEYLVSSLKGKTIVVHSPADFAKAMNQIAQKAK